MTESSRPTSFRAGRTLVLAMLGWSDAGEAASEAVNELQRHIGVNRVVRRIDDEEYYDYSTLRPRSEFNANGDRVIRWPATTFAGPIIPQSIEEAGRAPDVHRIYTLTGHEPSFRWRAYAREVIDAIARESISRVVIVGALLADTPHTRDIQVFLTSDSAEVRTDLGIDGSKYEGPTGVPGVLAHAAREAGVQVVSMWASVPHYTSNAETASPKAQLAIMDALTELLGFEFDRGELLAEAIAWEQQITDAVESDEDLKTYVRYLEDARDVVDSEAATGDAIAAEFERFLAKDVDGDNDGEFGNEPRS